MLSSTNIVRIWRKNCSGKRHRFWNLVEQFDLGLQNIISTHQWLSVDVHSCKFLGDGPIKSFGCCFLLFCLPWYLNRVSLISILLFAQKSTVADDLLCCLSHGIPRGNPYHGSHHHNGNTSQYHPYCIVPCFGRMKASDFLIYKN
jgi:hypothetical protein